MGCIFFLILVSAEFNIYFSGASHNVKIKVNKLIIHVGCVVMLASEKYWRQTSARSGADVFQ